MTISSRGWRATGFAAALGLAGTALGQHAASDDDATRRLQDRIAELEAKSARDAARNSELESRLASLEAENNAEWLTERRAQEIRGLVQDVLADADTRAAMQDSGMSAGYDNGFVISSSDGNWLLRTNMLMQQRFVLNRQRESVDDKSRWGFENSRTKLTLSGHVVQPDLFYVTEIELASNNSGLPNGENRTGLLDAYVGYDFGQGWRFWIGTFKAPLLREELVSAGSQLAAERSLTNYLFTGGRTDGIAVSYRNDQFHVVASYNNGVNDAVYGGGVATGGTSPVFSPAADYGFTARGEWLINGTWDAMEEFTSPRDGEHAMMLGGAAHYQFADSAVTAAADLDLLLLTIDFSAQFGGTNLFAALMYASAHASPGGTDDAVGFVIQGGHYISDVWELFARYEWADMDVFASDDVSIVTFGFNRYLANWNAKWTTDFGFGFDPVPFAAPITGWRADLPGENKQVVVRSQFQIQF